MVEDSDEEDTHAEQVDVFYDTSGVTSDATLLPATTLPRDACQFYHLAA